MAKELTKATVVSLYPVEINESKPGLYPGYFVIPAAPLGELSFLIVGDSVSYMETKNDQAIQTKTAFSVVAQSIVFDFMQGHVGRIPDVAEPGLFWVPGAYESQDEIKFRFEDEVREAERKQLRWFEELVKLADDQFFRTRRHNSVSTLQRLAAQRLNVSRPWSIRTGDSANSCRFCKAETPFGAVKCPNCREILDMRAYKELIRQGEEEFTE